MKEKRTINSFGNITIPKKMRDELGIVGGITTVQMFVRETASGDKEIVIRKVSGGKEIVEKYSKWSSVVSRILSCTVAIVWNKRVLMLSNLDNSMDVSDKKVFISPVLDGFIASMKDYYVVFRDNIPFLSSGEGIARAVFRIREECGDGFFVVVQGTKYDSEEQLTERDMMNRYAIVRDIVDRI